MLRGIDARAMQESKDFFTNPLIVRDRVREYNNLDPEPLFPPLGGDISRFRTDSYGDFILYASRITPIKRQLLAVRAMSLTSSPVRLILVGKPESPAYEGQIRSLVISEGLSLDPPTKSSRGSWAILFRSWV